MVTQVDAAGKVHGIYVYVALHAALKIGQVSIGAWGAIS
jgi:hypothetical protein